jgi:Cu-Zn family superoxide dismutase
MNKMMTPLAAGIAAAAAVSVFGRADAQTNAHGHGSAVSAAAKPVTKAVAVLSPTQGNNVRGIVTFTRLASRVRVVGEIDGLTPGEHGFHVHEFGDVSSPDGTSAGGHFNPTGAPHAGPNERMRHVGDMGNVTASADGKARVDLFLPISLEGPTGILGRSVVVHAKADDLKTQPSGDAGGRVAYGVIGVSKN